jgi:hypothetical protein
MGAQQLRSSDLLLRFGHPPSLLLNENFDNDALTNWSIIDEDTKNGPSLYNSGLALPIHKDENFIDFGRLNPAHL